MEEKREEGGANGWEIAGAGFAGRRDPSLLGKRDNTEKGKEQR